MELVFAHPQLLWLLVGILPLAILWKLKFESSKIYRYPLAHFLQTQLRHQIPWHKWFLLGLKTLLLALCIILIARPQWCEKISNIKALGIDIILSIDLSGSMQCFDDPTLKDRRSRITVAKQEALNFINNRLDDQIGVTIFAKDALTIAPLTIDKSMLESVISNIQLGDIEPNATNLAEGLALSVIRLNQSKAKSKIVVLLTDGGHNAQSNVSMEKAIQLAKDLQVKVYTIGIGSEDGAFGQTQFGQVYAIPGVAADMILLEKIAKETGGLCFNAKNPQELEAAYKQIDKLEKVERHDHQYFNYKDIFWPLMGSILALLLISSLLQATIWRGLW